MSNQPEKHFRLSPSSAHRWTKCPYAAMEGLPGSGHPTAAVGTNVHKICANLLLGDPIPAEIDAKTRRHVEMFVEHVQANDADDMFVEKCWVSNNIKDYGGTTDVTLLKWYVDSQIHSVAVYDYKNGKWPVAAEGNPQLLCYVDILREYVPTLNEFWGVIIQPNSTDGEQIKVANFTPDQIENHHAIVEWAATSNNVVTGSHCRFCMVRQIGRCPEGADYAAGKRGWPK